MPRGKKKTKNENVYSFINSEGKGYEKDIMLAFVIQRPGGRHIDVLCQDTIERKMFIRNGIRKRVWLNPSDVIVVSLRSFESRDKNCDFLYKLQVKEKKDFRKKNHLEFAKLLDDEKDDEEIIFDEDKKKKKHTGGGLCVVQENYFDDSDDEIQFDEEEEDKEESFEEEDVDINNI